MVEQQNKAQAYVQDSSLNALDLSFQEFMLQVSFTHSRETERLMTETTLTFSNCVIFVVSCLIGLSHFLGPFCKSLFKCYIFN